MSERLLWEPQSLVSEAELEQRALRYTNGKGGVTLFKNGTLLFVKVGADAQGDARLLMDNAKRLRNFRVTPMKDGGYIVRFNEAIGVFVGEQEFSDRQLEVETRIDELVFEGEKFEMPRDVPFRHGLIGVYARGKLQGDIYNFAYLKRL